MGCGERGGEREGWGERAWMVNGRWDTQLSTSNSTLADRDTAGVSVPHLERRPCPSSLPFLCGAGRRMS